MVLFKSIFCFFIVLILSVPYYNTLYAAEQESSIPQEISSEEFKAINNVAQILEFFQSEKGKQIWPNFDMTATPVIVWLDNGHIFAFNLKSNKELEGSKDVWSSIEVSHSLVKYTTQDLWGIQKVQMNPKFQIEGQTAYLFHLDLTQGDPSIQFLIFIHERFHSYQFENFVQEAHLNGYHKHSDIENLALILLEEYSLLDFLSAPSTKKAEHIKDFVAVHQTRQSKMDIESIRWERNQQRMEGLADYVSLKILEAPHLLPLFSSQAFLYATIHSYTVDPSVSDLAIKRRHYGVGAAIAYALDFMNVPDWKQRVERKESDLDELLTKAVSLSDAEREERVMSIKEHYGYSEIVSELSKYVNRYQETIHTLLKQSQEEEGIPVILHKPKNKSVSGGGHDLGMYWLPDGSTLSVENSSTSSTTDGNWEIKLTDLPYLHNGKNGESRFKIEKNLNILVDNRSYTLKELLASNEDKHFRQISWVSPQCEFRSVQHSGCLRVEWNQLVIDFN